MQTFKVFQSLIWVASVVCVLSKVDKEVTLAKVILVIQIGLGAMDSQRIPIVGLLSNLEAMMHFLGAFVAHAQMVVSDCNRKGSIRSRLEILCHGKVFCSGSDGFLPFLAQIMSPRLLALEDELAKEND